MPTTIQGQQVETLTSYNNFPKAGTKRFIRQYLAVSISPALNPHTSYISQQQQKEPSLVKDILKIKRHCWHFSITYYLKIQKASKSKLSASWERILDRNRLCISCFMLYSGHLSLPSLRDVFSGKVCHLHYCLATWPMILPKTSNSGKSSHYSRSSLNIISCPGPTQGHFHTHLLDMPLFHCKN